MVRAYLPNPGRLHELLLPGARLILAPNRGEGKSTSHVVMAVQRNGRQIFLHTSLNNLVARKLIELDSIPELSGHRIIRSEVPVGRSRFDFLLERDGKNVFLEVKSCTLFGAGVAMFPDAVTARGKKHLEELARLPAQGAEVAVLFLIHYPDVTMFSPDYHTDLDFSRTMIEVKDKVPMIAAAIEWNDDLSLNREVRSVAIPWDALITEVADRGAYLLLMEMKTPQTIKVGGLGMIDFKKGWYIYVGSAMANLTARIERHERRRKKMHWHVDWLRDKADRVVPLPIRSSAKIECEIAGAVGHRFISGPKGFGASDCSCPTHLFFSKGNPLHSTSFHETLQYFRARSFIQSPR